MPVSYTQISHCMQAGNKAFVHVENRNLQIALLLRRGASVFDIDIGYSAVISNLIILQYSLRTKPDLVPLAQALPLALLPAGLKSIARNARDL